MANYDYLALSPVGFEELCAAIVSEREQCFVERFTEGADGGIDLRMTKDGKTCIFQCKRYDRFSSLYTSLQKEVAKVEELNPDRYGVLTSAKLTPMQKTKIAKLFDGYIKKTEDIIGRHELNDLLAKENYQWVVDQTPGLWLPSFSTVARILFNRIVGRSNHLVTEFAKKNKRSIWTGGIQKALKKLRQNRVLVVAGNPGVGKTTAAELLALKSVREGFRLYVTYSDIGELEDVWNERERQVFLYDDFLGSNYCEAIENAGDTKICAFMNRVSDSDNKQFIITSRTTVLERGVADSEKLNRSGIAKSPYVCNLDELSGFEKAKILYNHMYYSNLSELWLKEIVSKRNYLQIVTHANFNPRLIEFFLQKENLPPDLKPEGFIAHVRYTLDHPDEVWRGLFSSQLNPLEHALVWVVFLERGCEEDFVISSFNVMCQNQMIVRTLKSINYLRTINSLLGSVLAREIKTFHRISIELKNPSIGDYLINSCKANLHIVEAALLAANNCRAINRFEEICRMAGISDSLKLEVYIRVFQQLDWNRSPKHDSIIKLACLMMGIESGRARDLIARKIKLYDGEFRMQAGSELLIHLLSQLDHAGSNIVTDVGLELSTERIASLFSSCSDFDSGVELYELMKKYGIPEPDNLADRLTDAMGETVSEKLISNLSEPEFEINGYSDWQIQSEDEGRLARELYAEIEDKIDDAGIPKHLVNIEAIMDSVDFKDYFQPSKEELDRYREYESDDYYYGRQESGSAKSVSFEETVDGIFRGFSHGAIK